MAYRIVFAVPVLGCVFWLSACDGSRNGRHLTNDSQAAHTVSRSNSERHLQNTAVGHSPAQFSEVFDSALSRMRAPYVLAGEDVRRIFINVSDLMQKSGDDEFARALERETDEVVSAVKFFVDNRLLSTGAFPKT